MKSSKIAIILILVGVTIIVINALDVLLGYKLTHGKGFQIVGVGLILLGLIVAFKSKLSNLV